MNKRDKFINAGIPYDELDVEMIDLLDVLNFDLGIKTKFCCYGHKEGEMSYVMFDERESDKNVTKILRVVDSNIGTSGVSQTKLYKWARTMYSLSRKEHDSLAMNWMLDIKHPSEKDRKKNIDSITKSLKTMSKYYK